MLSLLVSHADKERDFREEKAQNNNKEILKARRRLSPFFML